jgi:hypothetical protein
VYSLCSCPLIEPDFAGAARRRTPEHEDAVPGSSARPPSVISEAGASKYPARSGTFPFLFLLM